MFISCTEFLWIITNNVGSLRILYSEWKLMKPTSMIIRKTFTEETRYKCVNLNYKKLIRFLIIYYLKKSHQRVYRYKDQVYGVL